MDNVTKLLIQGAAGAAGGATYVDDVFSQYIWDGNSTAGRSINNGIDFAGEGGMIWIKARNQGYSPRLWDTVRGATKYIYSSGPDAQLTEGAGAATMLSSFDSNGVTLGQDSTYGGSNYPNTNYISWSFRKAPKFFDVVTYTGDADNLDSGESQAVPHNLGSTPGFILVKKTSGSQGWGGYHVSLGNQYNIELNSTANRDTDTTRYWNNTSPTSTHFTVGSSAYVNRTGETYVAYLFANNNGDGEFGEDGDKDIIKCTTYTGNSSGGQYVNLGFQPQWLLVKATNGSGGGNDWYIFDAMRNGLEVRDGDLAYLKPNDNGAEHSGVSEMYRVDSTGFTVDPGGTNYMNSGGRHYIVVAIRCSDGVVGKPPKVGTDAFTMDRADGSSTPCFISDFPVDFSFYRTTAASDSWYTGSRLSGRKYVTTFNSQEGSSANFKWDYNNGWRASGLDTNWMAWMWKRGPGMDVVMWDGNGSGGRQIAHNLGRVPEMMWMKSRSGNTDWRVYHSGVVGGYDGTNTWNTDSNAAKYQLYLNNAYWAVNNTSSFNQTQPTSTHFTVGTSSGVNTNGNWYVNLLFSSVSGISKCGSYTGSSSELTITTGFQPRFVIIKNIRNQGNNWTTGWFTFDTTRGWAAGNNDYYMRLNDTGYQDAGSQQDWTNPISTGFTINANSGNHLNNNGEEYIYYAHA